MPLVLRRSSLALPTDLGFFTSAVERQPVLVLALSGAAAGIATGVLAGLLYGVIFDRKNLAVNAIKSGGIGGAVLGLKGAAEGRNLQAWLIQSSSLQLPPSDP
jgi:hypothetical protein